MVVNSFSFLLFFVVVFTIYYLPLFRKTPVFQNICLLLSSYVFYGITDVKMIPILLGATIIFYSLGFFLYKEQQKGNEKGVNALKIIGVVLGVGLLLYFKYLNFFIDQLSSLLKAIGFNVTWSTLHIIMPIGVSFFTFKLISYIIEIARGHIEPSRSFVQFAVYISFFPTILSGPIDRPNNFLPQLKTVKTLDYSLAVDGLRQILWGMFIKMCIADNLASVTDIAWANYHTYPSSSLLVAALLYPIQIYADFCGYSDMAIGVSKLLGLNVARNFNHPYLARNVAEYWRRWHMSLTSWITDYVFMPLNVAFRNLGNLGMILAIIINLVVIGLWHGANWTFGVFGLYHGLLFVPLILSGAFMKKAKLKENKYGLPLFGDLCKMIGTYLLVALGHIIFRADSINDAVGYIKGIITPSIISLPTGLGLDIIVFVFIVVLLVSDWLMRKYEFNLQLDKVRLGNSKVCRFAIYYVLIVLIYLYHGSSSNFIYFQF